MLPASLNEEQRLLLDTAVKEARLCDELLRSVWPHLEDFGRLALRCRALVNIVFSLAEEPSAQEGAASPSR